jgi:ribonuclease HII
MKFTVGIDEAGRGPLAGPLAVGVVAIPAKSSNPSTLLGVKKFFKGIKDSKKLSQEDRELWYSLALEAKKKGEFDFKVILISEKVIDNHGMAYALRLGIKRALKSLNIPEEDSQIFLDGGIKAPKEFKHQLTVVKGDEKIPVISLASICAKVVRDRKMVRFAKQYPLYAFDLHKGYGTRLHREAIRKYGSTKLHRQSFLRNLTKAQQL